MPGYVGQIRLIQESDVAILQSSRWDITRADCVQRLAENHVLDYSASSIPTTGEHPAPSTPSTQPDDDQLGPSNAKKSTPGRGIQNVR